MRLAAVLGLDLAAAACDSREAVYFLMDFDAVVEGETFAFKSKIACEPKWAPGDMFNKEPYFGVDRYSFGMKLKSGKGVFVAAPDICYWYYKTVKKDGVLALEWDAKEHELAILPTIYVTDSYENPVHLWLYANPNGPDPKTGMELRKATLRPLSEEEARTSPERERDDHDPFWVTGDLVPNWQAYAFVPLPEGIVASLLPNLGDAAVETERYKLYRLPNSFRQYGGVKSLLSSSEQYWSNVTRAVPLNAAMGFYQILSAKRPHKKNEILEDEKIARKVFSENIPLVFKNDTVFMDEKKTGVIHAYRSDYHLAHIIRNKSLRLKIGGTDTVFSANPLQFWKFILVGPKSNEIYGIERLYLIISVG